MTDGSVICFPAGPDLPGQAIKFVTHGPAHIARVAGGFVWDDTLWTPPGRILWSSGPRVTLIERFDEVFKPPYLVRDPVIPWTAAETRAAVAWAIAQVNSRRPYNIAELLLFAAVYPTRAFWDKIGWVPFEHSHEYVCSTFGAAFDVDAGRYAFGTKAPQEIAPVDFITNQAWRDEA